MKGKKIIFKDKNNNYDIKFQTLISEDGRIINENYQLLQTDIYYTFRNQFEIYYIGDLNHVVFKKGNYKIEINLIDLVNGTVEIKFYFKNKLIESTVLKTPNTLRIIKMIANHNNYYNLKLLVNAI